MREWAGKSRSTVTDASLTAYEAVERNLERVVKTVGTGEKRRAEAAYPYILFPLKVQKGSQRREITRP